MFVCVSSCVRYDAGHVQRRSISKRCRYFHQQMVSLRWIERWTARCIRNRSLCVCVYVFVCVCVCRSLQEEVQQPMEPIAEERIEMPEAQTNADSRDMLRCSKHKLANTHKHTHTDTQTYFVTPRNA